MGKGLFGRVQQELEAREKTPGLTMADIISLPDDLRRLVNWMMREGDVQLAEMVAHMEADEDAVRSMLKNLLEKGFVSELEIEGETCYRVRLAPRRRRDIPLDIWQCLEDKVEEE